MCQAKPPLATKTMCERCRNAVRGCAIRQRERFREKGLCFDCGKEPHIPNRIKCADCAMRSSERSSKNRRLAKLETCTAQK